MRWLSRNWFVVCSVAVLFLTWLAGGVALRSFTNLAAVAIEAGADPTPWPRVGRAALFAIALLTGLLLVVCAWLQRECVRRDQALRSSARNRDEIARELAESRQSESALREESQRALQEHEQRYRHLVEVCPDAILVNRDDKIAFVNDACLKLLGADSPGQVLGKPALEIVHPEFQPVVRGRIHQLRASAQPVPLIEEKFLRLDGSTVEVEVAAAPFLDQGRMSIQVVARDISERKKAEREKRDLFNRLSAEHEKKSESEAKYRALIEVTDTGYVIVDDHGCVLDANAEFVRLTGHARLEEIRGRPVTDWTAPHDLERNAEEVRKCIATGETRRLEIDYIDSTDRITPIEINGRVIESPVGLRIVALCRDITERKRAERELRTSHERLSHVTRQLIATQETERRHLARELHDEIGQVLTAISIHLQTTRAQGGAQALPVLEECASIVTQAIQQVRDLSLDMRPPMLDDFGLAAALKWYLGRQQQRLGTDIHFTAETSGGRLPPEIEAACFRVVQEAVTNILRHARARNVWVELHQEDRSVELVVRDDGAGFDVAEARHRATQGNSLGLLGMQERVQLLGGEFAIDSVPGRGTTIRLRLTVPWSSEDEEEASP